MYNIQRVTADFGPVGEGWGYECDWKTIEWQNHLILCLEVFFWVESPDKKIGPYTTFETMGAFKKDRSGKLMKEAPTIDVDAGKKCLSDALSKWLSHLGYSADVFMGLFDNPNYREYLTRKDMMKPVESPDPEESSQSQAETGPPPSLNTLKEEKPPEKAPEQVPPGEEEEPFPSLEPEPTGQTADAEPSQDDQEWADSMMNVAEPSGKPPVAPIGDPDVKISEQQIEEIKTILTEGDVPDETVRQIMDHFGINSFRDLTAKAADITIKRLKRVAKKG